MFKTISIALTIMLASGCATMSRMSAPDDVARASLPEFTNVWSAADAKLGAVKNGWIGQYNDPVLVALVNEAQANNRNLQAASARIDKAWALARKAGAVRAVQTSGVGSAGGGGNFDGVSNSDFQLGVQASWELDLWGRLKSGQNAAELSAESVEADVKFARLSLAQTVASAYFSAVEAHQQTELLEKTISDLTEIVRITQIRHDNGMASSQDLSLAISDMATSQSRLEALKTTKNNALRSIEVLLGRYPGADVETASILMDTPDLPPAGLPSAVLERRPDIIAAEQRIAASFETVNQAKAAKLPSISLTGTASGASSSLSDIVDPANLLWNAAAGLLVPLTNGGSLDAEIASAEADQKEAIANYGQAALEAFQNVEVSLDAASSLQRQLGFTETALKEAQNSLDKARLQYDTGNIDLLSVLIVQQRARDLESSLLSLRSESLINYGQLNLALGGHWDGS